jgi:transposase-like protein
LVTPRFEGAFRKGEKHAVGSSWRMDETYIKAKGKWKIPLTRRLQEREHHQLPTDRQRDK